MGSLICLIVYAPATKQIQNRWIANGWQSNNDGAGYVFVKDGELVIRKPYYKLRALIRDYMADYKIYGQSSVFVMHLRKCSHGDMKEGNVHPHSLANGKAALVHNGVLSDFLPPSGQKLLSDTTWFCKTVLVDREAEQLVSLPFCNQIGDMIGSWNKMIILTAKDCTIIHKDKGNQTEEGFWFSNDSWKYAWTKCEGTVVQGYSGASTFNGIHCCGGIVNYQLPVKQHNFEGYGDAVQDALNPFKIGANASTSTCLPPTGPIGESKPRLNPSDWDAVDEKEWKEHWMDQERVDTLEQMQNLYDYYTKMGMTHLANNLIDQMNAISKQKTPIVVQDGSGFSE